MKKIVFASSNQGKIRELSQLLTKVNFNVVPQAEFSIPDVHETGLSFVENAILKARHAANLSGLPAIADDSGLIVNALNGEPGIFSARYSGKDATAESNIDQLLTNLTGVEQRQAHFVCVLVFMEHPNDPVPLICEGRLDGTILTERQGEKGFGYDPIFFIESENKTAAELSLERKNQISHRGKALQQLLEKLSEKLCLR